MASESATNDPGEQGSSPQIASLNPDDRQALSAFSCRSLGEPWSELAQEMVRERLADALEVGGVEALGLWVGERLIGVTAWRLGDADGLQICSNIVLAVAIGSHRQGFGRVLKEAVLQRARDAGARAVVSEVHWDNDAMIGLNIRLGASVERIDGDPDYCRCIIPLADE